MTLRDISRRSGFSVTTVSRALNGFSDVAEETRRRIEAIAREMNYRPNQAARKLVSGRSGMVGLVSPAPPLPFEHGHFFEIVTGLSRAFSARDMDFVLHVGAGEDALGIYRRQINRGTLDGFVLTAPAEADPRIALLREADAAFVVHGRESGAVDYGFYDLDNLALSEAAVGLVAEAGHRRIALLNGPAAWAYSAQRLEGFRQALARRGLPFDPALVRHGDTSQDYGAREAIRLLGVARPPTAIVCCNTLTAAGVYAGLRTRGLCAPRDVSVVAHDDDLPQVRPAALDPPLTVTLSPLRAAAEPLAERLVRRIGGAPGRELQALGEFTIIRRASVAPRPDRRRG